MTTIDKKKFFRGAVVTIAIIAVLVAGSIRLQATIGTCGGASTMIPFTDVPSINIFFCSIASAFFSGLTSGTSATTYSPADPVSREQMAAFVTRTLDQSLQRGSQRAALQRFWDIPRAGRAEVDLGGSLRLLASDGVDVWVANPTDDTVLRVRGTDGKILETWTNATQAVGVLALHDRVFVTGKTTPGRIYRIQTNLAPGDVAIHAVIGSDPEGIAFDGLNIWTANNSGSVSRVIVSTGTATTFTGFVMPRGIIFDGTFVWVTDAGAGILKKLDLNGNVLQDVVVGNDPRYPAFDGTNIWVPNFDSDSVSVVRASTGQVIQTLTGNGLDNPISIAFDGERIVVANNGGGSASFWKATSLIPIGVANINANFEPFGVCSDGLRFFITFASPNSLIVF